MTNFFPLMTEPLFGTTFQPCTYQVPNSALVPLSNPGSPSRWSRWHEPRSFFCREQCEPKKQCSGGRRPKKYMAEHFLQNQGYKGSNTDQIKHDVDVFQLSYYELKGDFIRIFQNIVSSSVIKPLKIISLVPRHPAWTGY